MTIKNLSVKPAMKDLARAGEKFKLVMKNFIIGAVVVATFIGSIALYMLGFDRKKDENTPPTSGSPAYGIEGTAPSIDGNADTTQSIDADKIMTIDISVSQQNIDWDYIEANYGSVILKATSHEDIALRFKENSEECSKRNIPYATYCCNYKAAHDAQGNLRTEEDMYELQVSQVNTLLEALKGKDVKLPVFLDFEDFDGNREYATNYTPEQCVGMLNAWRDKLTEAGYTVGIYANEAHAKKLKEAYDKAKGKKGAFEQDFVIWLAGDFVDGVGYKTPISIEDLVHKIKDHKGNLYDVPGFDRVDILQVTRRGKKAGASNAEGDVDINIINPDGRYRAGMKSNNHVRNLALTVAGVALGSGAVGYAIHRHKKSTSKKRKGKVKTRTRTIKS